MKVLCIGDIDESLAEKSKAIAEHSQLVTSENFKHYIQNKTGYWYTSLGDLSSPQQLEQAIVSADKIIFFEPSCWSHPDCKSITEYLLFKYSWQKTIDNFHTQSSDPLQIFSSVQQRKTQSAQLWAVGCSVTFGYMLPDQHKWANVLSQRLGIEHSLLAMPGSGVDWQARQILNADLKADDTVCWLMPNFNRYEISNNFSVLDRPRHFSMGAYEEHQSWLPDFVKNNNIIKKIFPNVHKDEEYQVNLNWFAKCYYPYQILINHLTLIKQVVKQCNDIKLFVLTQKIIGDHTQQGMIDFYLSKLCQNYLGQFEYDYNTWPDLAEDNAHPGSITHQLFADKFYQAIVAKQRCE